MGYQRTTETKKNDEAQRKSTSGLNRSPRPTSDPIHAMLHLHQIIGNQAVRRLLDSGVIQAKLKIGKTGDKYEQEADRVADWVMRIANPKKVQRANRLKEAQVSERYNLTLLPIHEIHRQPTEQTPPETTSPVQIEIQRDTETEEATLGTLTLGTLSLHILELPDRNNAATEDSSTVGRINEGTYSAHIRSDGSLGWRIELENVPGRANIQIHVGNTPSETTGCLLPGTSRGENRVNNSQNAINSISNAIPQGAQIQVTIIDPPGQQQSPESTTENVQPYRRSSQIFNSNDLTTPIINLNKINESGHPLPVSVRSFFEPRFGYDLSQIRLNTDAKAAEFARALNARAYTIGQHIVFGSGEYLPATQSTMHLLAHEITHVIQQNHGQNVLRKTSANQKSIIQQQELSKQEVGQGISWVKLDNPTGLIAQIFFPTNQSSLDENDKKVLREIFNAYSISLLGNRYSFRFVGYADYRGPEKYNKSLALDRAKTVSEFFVTREPFQSSDLFEYKLESRGESQTPQFGRTSEQLSPFRRVDIIAEPPLVKPEPVKQKRKILEPPPKEVSPAPEKEADLGQRLPSGGIMFKVALPSGVSIPVGQYLMIYPSGEIRGTFTLKTGRPETFMATWKEGKLGLVVKQKLVEGLEFKGTLSGELGISFYNIPLHPEVMWQPLEFHKPVTLNILESVTVSEIDIGQGMKITGKVGLNLKLGVGPGPAMAASFGTAGIIVGGTIAGTIGVIYATARITEAARERGIAWGNKISRRYGYAWRMAGEAAGDYGYHIAISTIELNRGKESYPATYEGWTLADRGLKNLSVEELDFMIKSLTARYGRDVSRLHSILFELLGGLLDDDTKLPTSPLAWIIHSS